MGIKCPKCQFENPSDSKFCKECGTQIIPLEEIPASPTKTLETPTEELNTGSTFAGRYEIMKSWAKEEWVRSTGWKTRKLRRKSH